MHIPGGFLSDPVCTACTLATGATVAVGAVRLRAAGASPAAMGALGAGIFAAQMVNFPVDHGTSGHVIGAAAATALLGPWAAMLVMAAVLAIQCLLFGDGAVSTLGVNILNMGVVAVATAWVVNRVVRRQVPGRHGAMLAGGLAAWVSVIAAASACSLELAASGTYGLADVMSAMLNVHAAIGIGEALVTAAVVAIVFRSAEARSIAQPARLGTRRLAAALAIAVGIAMLLAPLASSAPDGLERVAQNLGFADQALPSAAAIAPDYVLPGFAWQPLAVALAGTLGVVAAFAGSWAVCRVARYGSSAEGRSTGL